MKKITWIFLMTLIAACSAASAEPTITPSLPYDTLTPLAATADPMRAQIDQLNAAVHSLETQLADQSNTLAQAQAELASLHAQGTEAALALTPTITPTYQYTPTPSNVMWVVANRKLNLRTIHSYNDAGRPIMVIIEPRVQYQEGEMFLVYIPIILADGGDRYYEVYGPRGAGLYVRTTDVNRAE